ncbi:MAG: hypothetical protein NT136_01815 [Candidatus Moranbacteria bacterium]|nr:hypothetical protein [Candidatus Moranbacteria bacterium]
MYESPQSLCSALLHLLLKHPILIIALGLAAVVSITSIGFKEDPSNVEQKIQAKIEEVTSPQKEKMANEAPPTFKAIMKAESGLSLELLESAQIYFEAISRLGGVVKGAHPDKKSFGPPGLTRIALEDVLKKLPDCKDLGFDEILNDSEASTKFAYLYFLDLIYRFKSVETAVIAYHHGPTFVQKSLKEGKKLPRGYLDKVRSILKQK